MLKYKNNILLTFLLIFVCSAINQTQPIAYNGKAITAEVQSNIIELIKKASILYWSDVQNTTIFLQNELPKLYPGAWNVMVMFNCYQNQYQYSNYSMNGQWWLYWKGKNPYIPSLYYGMQRVSQTYKPENRYMDGCQLREYGNGFSQYQKQLMYMFLLKEQPIEKLKKFLNEQIQEGNWNIVKNTYWGPYFGVWVKDNKWFNGQPYNCQCSYLVYLS